LYKISNLKQIGTRTWDGLYGLGNEQAVGSCE